MSKFSKKIFHNLKPYKPASQELWKDLDSKIIKLDWNEGTQDPPLRIKEQIINFLDKGLLRYYPNVNNYELIDEICSYVNCERSQITYFSGIDHLHEYIAKCFIEKGDQVDVVYPTYDNFRSVIESAEGKINYIDEQFIYADSGFRTESKICYIVNPNNPTGTLYDPKILKKITRNNQDTLFIIDEAYIEYAGTENSASKFLDENILICRTFSKAFCLAGLRLGYAIADSKIIDTLNLVRNPKSVSMFAQIGALVALKNKEYMFDHVKLVSEYKVKLTTYLQEKFSNLNIFNSESSSLLVQFNSEVEKNDFKNYLESNHIYVRDASGMVENSIRITIPVNKEFESLVQALKSY